MIGGAGDLTTAGRIKRISTERDALLIASAR
jgi:hypothetical protein